MITTRQNSITISLSVTPGEAQHLKVLAAKYQTSVSDIIRQGVQMALKAIERDKMPDSNAVDYSDTPDEPND